MLKHMEHANITVSSIDEAETFLKLAFPEFSERGEGKSDKKSTVKFVIE